MAPYIHIVLPTFIVFAFFGGSFALTFVFFRIDKYNVKFTVYLKMATVCAFSAYLGGIVLSVLTRIPQLITNFSFSNLFLVIAQSGIVFYGGLFGVLLAVKLYTRYSHYEASSVYRMITPAIPLFHGIGRIGCLFGGCCYGRELAVPISLFGMLHFDRVPTQVFEAVFGFLIFFVIIFIERKRNEWDSLQFYLLAYATFRFANEFFRGDEARGLFLGLSTSQWISVFILVYYAIKHLRNLKLNKTTSNVINPASTSNKL